MHITHISSLRDGVFSLLYFLKSVKIFELWLLTPIFSAISVVVDTHEPSSSVPCSASVVATPVSELLDDDSTESCAALILVVTRFACNRK